MSDRELDAAGIREPQLRASYVRCRRLLAEHGKTYYLAALLLPPAQRPFIQAIYGFARHVDEMVDRQDHDRAEEEPLVPWSERLLADLRAGRTDDKIGSALLHTITTWNIPIEHIEVFLDAMRSDLSVTEYPTYADLERYLYGAAAVLGLQMTPILGPRTEKAYGPMGSLGIAFQLNQYPQRHWRRSRPRTVIPANRGPTPLRRAP